MYLPTWMEAPGFTGAGADCQRRTLRSRPRALRCAAMNKLFYGDNLEVLRGLDAASVDLIYLDPPFNSNASYNILFRSPAGQAADSQIEAFDDTWHWGATAEAAFDDVMKSPHTDVAELLRTMRSFLRDNDMMAYLAMMAVRLIELHRVLKPTGSLYLHCDPTASHYLKLLLDGVFGADKFRSEIIWKRSSAHNDGAQGRKQHGRIHDVLFFYTKTDDWLWNALHTPYDESYKASFYRHVEKDTGRRYRLGDLTGPGGAAKGNPQYEVMGVTRYWRYSRDRMAQLISEGRVIQTRPGTVPQYKRYLDEMPGVPLQDIWSDTPPISAQAKERERYPTQKPLALLERIIAASSNPGDVVLDPFCGCGTALEAAQKLGRGWIGIDVTHLAIHLIEKRLRRQFGDAVQFTTEGRPKDLHSAQELALRDKHEFQKWITTFVGGIPWRGGRKGADGGIDGIINFDGIDLAADKPVSTKAIISVKGGANKSVTHVAELVETIGRENAAVGVLLTAALPSREMERRAAAAGFYDLGAYGRFPRIQILTLKEVMDGKRPALPNIDRTLVGKSAKPADPRSPKLL